MILIFTSVMIAGGLDHLNHNLCKGKNAKVNTMKCCLVGLHASRYLLIVMILSDIKTNLIFNRELHNQLIAIIGRKICDDCVGIYI